MPDRMKLRIDGKDVETEPGTSVLEACLEAGIYVPHLCHHPDLTPRGYCGLCKVEIEGEPEPVSACMTPAADGMKARTQSEQLARLRRSAVEYILAAHPEDCGTCVKYLNCELQALKQYFSIDKLSVERRQRLFAVDSSNPLFVIDANKCVMCGRCLRACHELRGVGVLYRVQTESEPYIGTATGQSLAEAGCRFCGACAEVCPTGAILDKQELTEGKSRKAALVPCRHTCPAQIDVPGYVRLVKAGDYAGAVNLIRQKAPLPGVLGHVCDRPCEPACRRNYVNESVCIRDLKRFAAERSPHESKKKNAIRRPATGKKVAIIGSGPAGLTAAYYLTLQGHAVTVFEAMTRAGGMLRYGIPRYRLPDDILDSEIKEIVELGIEIKTDTYVDSIESLLQDGYDALMVAVGTQKGQRLRIPGADHPHVLVGVDFLREVNLGRRVCIGRTVVVLGGGNVAFDCARVARRLGAEHVSVACLESLDKLPAAPEEVLQAQEEGIDIFPSRSFIRIPVKEDKIAGVECLKVESFQFDEDKNLQIEVAPGSEHILPADTVIFATGQRPEVPDGFGLSVRPNGTIELDEFTLGTNREGVYAAGDAVCGTSSVIQAIASARKAAMAVDRYLGGNGDFDSHITEQALIPVFLGRQDGFAELTKANGNEEAARCLQCDLRLNIKRVRIWSDY